MGIPFLPPSALSPIGIFGSCWTAGGDVVGFVDRARRRDRSSRDRVGAARNLHSQHHDVSASPRATRRPVIKSCWSICEGTAVPRRILTYGVQEAKDISQVIDALERQQMIVGEIGVMGISYGATTSIHLAACDPHIRAVVAVEPFGMVRPAIERFGDVLAPEISWFVTDGRCGRGGFCGKNGRFRSRRF